MTRTLLALLVFGLSSFAAPALAQEDKAGCKDIALFNRMPDHYIENCSTSPFVARKFPAGPMDKSGSVKTVLVEGVWTMVVYRPKSGTTPPNALQIQKNFQAAAKKAGASIEGSYPEWCKVTLDDSFGFGNGCTGNGTTLKFTPAGKEAWVFINGTSKAYTGHDEGYAVMMVERDVMSQDIIATDLLDTINKDGLVAIYLNFETGSATLQPTSDSQVEQIVAMLKANPALNVEVAGHTDNVGAADANQKLSDARAAAVMKALVAKGIAAKRLTSKGYGPIHPIADNRREDGRAKNRRVELIKK